MLQFILSRIKSFAYAFKGIRTLFATQPNAWIHLLAAALVSVLGVWLQLSFIEWAILALTIGTVIAAEAFNTALEFLTDLVSPDYHPLAGKTKDVAAAGVLITALAAIGVGVFIFLPKILALF